MCKSDPSVMSHFLCPGHCTRPPSLPPVLLIAWRLPSAWAGLGWGREGAGPGRATLPLSKTSEPVLRTLLKYLKSKSVWQWSPCASLCMHGNFLLNLPAVSMHTYTHQPGNDPRACSATAHGARYHEVGQARRWCLPLLPLLQEWQRACCTRLMTMTG